MNKQLTRKLKKKKEKQKTYQLKKHLEKEEKVYQDKFPAFKIQNTKEANSRFVELITDAINKIDFRRVPYAQQQFLQQLKRNPKDVRAEIRDHLKNPAELDIAVTKISFLGNLVYSLVPKEELLRYVPYYNFEVVPNSPITVRFRGLASRPFQGGTAYFSPKEPYIIINGKRYVVAFTRHAIDRICQRVRANWQSYVGMSDLFGFVYRCRYFQPVMLPNKELGFTLFEECSEGFITGKYSEQILNKKATAQPTDKNALRYYYRIGYCPAVIENGMFVAKTLLYPGYKNTPESSLIKESKMPFAKKREFYNRCNNILASDLQDSDNDFSLLKWFHDNGIPQVIQTKRQFYDYST